MYKFDGYAGQTLYYSIVPPLSADFGFEIYDPGWTAIAGADSGTGATYYGSFTPSLTNSYYLKVYLTSGSGTYAFILSTTPVPPDFTITAGSSTLYGCPGGATGELVTFQSIRGFSGTVTVSASQSPTNSYSYPWAYSPVTLSSGGTSSTDAGIWTQDSDFSQGTYTITVTGVSGSLSRQTSFPVNISYNNCNSKGGKGSVAYGTLITLADGSQMPVQNLHTGLSLLTYDLSVDRYMATTITGFTTVNTDNQMVIRTSDGKPLIVDQNPDQELYAMLPGGSWSLTSVTELRIGYSLYDAMSRSWAPITGIEYQNGGQHIMYDIYTTSPGSYIANGYLDPQKN